ncbi:uncharacterized protein A1O9_01210 [Exophiala aquamarina CBS 119918]|uniref:Major facilitator superfamily (MFS) profile domain-containing protein n=1 Tax=Exophiala aquamarina CBS 119918 TaxID=1182545 RepID=A0A072PV72_9EURO|nr:uncharacterized protein A1O9_01210 [Exophiala aquamarina CBS 119918]KEF63233.1 hypothetical protein A1O9_01210 [Exophiala aquamarina CBS 119918]
MATKTPAAIFFSALHYSDHQIGIFMTLTLLGDVFLGTFLTLIADRVGRRRVLMGGSFLMVLSGFIFAIFENFWILLAAAILGVISVTGGDFGPFRSIEESMLSQLTSPSTRADVLAWYVTTSTLGSSAGSEASGRIIHYLKDRRDWTEVDTYHALFWVYTVMGLVNALLVLPLTSACELDTTKADSNDDAYTQVPQDEDIAPTERSPTAAIAENTAAFTPPTPPLQPMPSPSHSWLSRTRNWATNNLARISSTTRNIMYKLWFLLAIDSLADGMVPYSLTNYYMDVKFHPAKSTLGDITSISYFLGAIGAAFAGPLARKIGLINTMVFTHVPSSAAVLFFPFPPSLWLTAALLLLRTGLNNMDQAPRSAFIAAVVRPEERTAAMGITSMVRTLAAMAGPSVTGVLASNKKFWIAFVFAGVCRLAYDFGLYAMFVNMKLHQHEGGPGSGKDEEGPRPNRYHHRHRRQQSNIDDAEDLEMGSLAGSSSSGSLDDARDGAQVTATPKSKDMTTEKFSHNSSTSGALQVPSRGSAAYGAERARSRSPHGPTALMD